MLGVWIVIRLFHGTCPKHPSLTTPPPPHVLISLLAIITLLVLRLSQTGHFAAAQDMHSVSEDTPQDATCAV